ncbi:unnamed protein product [Bathycoccus prasinos]
MSISLFALVADYRQVWDRIFVDEVEFRSCLGYRSQSSSLKLFLKESLCLFVSFESKSEREKERVGWSQYAEGTTRALCFIAAFFASSNLGFESV